MKRAFLLTVAFLMFTGIAAANGRHSQIDNSSPEVLNGQVIEINARVIAISADSKSMELFDSENSRLIQVRLTQLPKSERSALMLSGVRRVEVSGRASIVAGRLSVDAQRVVVLPVATESAASATTKEQR
jgi:hypothetical protein